MSTTLAWRDLTVGGPDSPYRIRTLEGWEARPAARYDKQVRARSHGAHPSRVLADERIVTVEGWCFTPAERDQLLADLQAASGFGDGDDTEPLTVTAAGRTLTAGAQLLEARPVLERGRWGAGWFGWLLQWRCPDPLRYGAPVEFGPVGLPTQGGGLVHPLTYPLTYGEPGQIGQLTLHNPGNATASIMFAVRGPLPEGFELSAAGQRITYAAEVPAGQIVELNTDTGEVLVEGTASRRGYLTSADWMRVPAAGSLTVQFTSLGGDYDAAAQLAAIVKGAYW